MYFKQNRNFLTALQWRLLLSIHQQKIVATSPAWSKSFLSLLLTCSCCCLVTKLYLTLWRPHGLQPARLLSPWDFPGKNTGVGCHLLLQKLWEGMKTHHRLTNHFSEKCLKDLRVFFFLVRTNVILKNTLFHQRKPLDFQ